MIDCPNGDVRDLLPDFLHGRLDASRRTEVEQHLAGCEACRDELSLLRGLRATMDRGPRVRVDEVAAAIPPYRPPVRRSSATAWRAAAAIAARTRVASKPLGWSSRRRASGNGAARTSLRRCRAPGRPPALCRAAGGP